MSAHHFPPVCSDCGKPQANTKAAASGLPTWSCQNPNCFTVRQRNYAASSPTAAASRSVISVPRKPVQTLKERALAGEALVGPELFEFIKDHPELVKAHSTAMAAKTASQSRSFSSPQARDASQPKNIGTNALTSPSTVKLPAAPLYEGVAPIPPSHVLYLRRDNVPNLMGTSLPSVSRSPSQHLNYDGERNWDSSGYLSLFRYDFKDLSVTENQLPNAVLAINRIYSKFIHFLFLPIDIQESHLQDSDPEAPHWVYKLPNIPGPHFFRTDKLHPPSKVNPETKEVIEYASRYICEHLYLGPWDPDRMTVYTETESEDSLFASLRKRAAERKPVPTEEIIEHLNKRFAQTPLSAATSATASNATMVGNNPPIGVRGCSRQPRIEKPPYTAAASSTSGYVSQSSSSAVVTSTAYFEPNRVEPPPPTPLTTNSPPDNSGAVGEPSQKKQKLDGDVAAACTANDPNESYLSPIPPIASLGTTRQRERSASSNIASNASSSSAAVASSSAASRSSPSTSDEARMFDDQHK